MYMDFKKRRKIVGVIVKKIILVGGLLSLGGCVQEEVKDIPKDTHTAYQEEVREMPRERPRETNAVDILAEGDEVIVQPILPIKSIKKNQQLVKEESFNTPAINSESASREVLEQIQKELNDTTSFRLIDKRDPESYEWLIMSLVLRGKVGDAEYVDIENFTGYAEEKVAEQMKLYYDIDLDGYAMGLPSPRNTNYSRVLHYENGVYYLSASDLHREFIRNVTAAKKVKANTYLVNYEDTFYSPFPEDIQDSTVTPGYAVVKLVNGIVQVHYLGYRKLTEEELGSF